MEVKCKYIKELEKRNNKRIRTLVICILLIAIILLCKIHWSKLSLIFYNENGTFSNEIFWSAIGAVGSILALIGVILTIKYTEYSRKKQNEYEFQKEQILKEHSAFQEEVKKQLEILDPIRVLNETIKLNEINKCNNIIDKLNNYVIEIKSIDYKIYWYYNRTMQDNYVELRKFNNQLNEFIEYMTEKIKEYNECLCNYYYTDLKKDNLNLTEGTEQFIKKIGEIKTSIAKYRNDNWNIIVESAKVMIEEREKIIKEKLNLVL